MCTLGDTLQPTLSTNPAIRHLFRLRKIQASIRRSRENRPRDPLARDGKGYTSSFKSALDRWRQEIPHYESDNDQHGYLHPIWMRKLYVYSLLILMEEKRDFIEMDGTEDILVTIAEACLNFRLLQEEGHVMCFTWSAVCVKTPVSSLSRHTRSELTINPLACIPIPSRNHDALHCLGNSACL
jgi:hypothetical protein